MNIHAAVMLLLSEDIRRERPTDMVRLRCATLKLLIISCPSTAAEPTTALFHGVPPSKTLPVNYAAKTR